MSFIAKVLYIPYSPYKLRPLANVIRGKPVVYALNWLKTYKSRRTVPIKKLVESAVANAKNLKNIEPVDLWIENICVDEGPRYRYYKPGIEGRLMPHKRRQCHISVKLEVKNKKVAEE